MAGSTRALQVAGPRRTRVIVLAGAGAALALVGWAMGEIPTGCRELACAAPSVAAPPHEEGPGDDPEPPSLDGEALGGRSVAELAEALGATARSSGSDPDGGAPGDGLAPAPSRPAAERARTPSLKSTENVLLVGLDRRPGGRSRGRADTLLVVVMDARSRHVGVVSVPRDLYVDIPGHGPVRINNTLRVAPLVGREPLELAREVVGSVLALPIHHVVAVDLGLFERTVDLLGGVEVDVPCPIQDNFLDRRGAHGRVRLDVPAGRVSMDGVTAAMYARSRHGRSDWSRARRQQAILVGIRDRLATVGGAVRLPWLVAELRESVVTDLSEVELLSLARRGVATDFTRLHGLVLGYRHVFKYRSPTGQHVLLPNYAEIDAAVSALFEAPAPGAPLARAECPPADVALHHRGQATGI